MNVSEPYPTLGHSNYVDTYIETNKCDIQERTSHLHYILPVSPCDALNKFKGTDIFPLGIFMSKFHQR